MDTLSYMERCWRREICSLPGRRDENEDIVRMEHVSSVAGKGALLFLACDGMGGLPHGKAAAAACADMAFPIAKRLLMEKGHALFYRGAAETLRRALVDGGAPRGTGCGGTTLVLLAFCLDRFHDGYRLLLTWSGDSRAYVMQENAVLTCLTTDDHDEEGALTAYYDAGLGTFAGDGLHVREYGLPHLPLALGVTTDGLHTNCSPEEFRAFLAWRLLGDLTPEETAYGDFLEYNLSDNASCAFAMRRTMLPHAKLMTLVQEKHQ